MRPVLLRVGGFALRAYPTLLYFGLLSGVAAGQYVARQSEVDPVRVSVATVFLAAAALLGARLLFVALHWDVYRREPLRIWRRSEGGAALYGGLVLPLILSVPLLRALDLPFGAFWDLATVTILVGMIPTRLGCFLNGCCAGRPSQGPLALYLPGRLGRWERRIPVQLLEAAWAAVLLAATAAWWSRRPFDGSVFLAAIGGYGIGRFVLESLRETVDRIGPFSVNRAISLALVAASLLVFFLRS